MSMGLNFYSKLSCYALMVVVLVYSLIVDGMAMPSQYNVRFGTYGGKWKYLTHLNMWMQAIYWVLVVLAGLSTYGYEPKKRRGTLHTMVDYFHASLAFPVGIFVCVTFWLIYAVDRELVYPKSLDEFIPQWLNHVMHTVHLPFLVIDKYLTRHRYPRQMTGMCILIVFAAAYNAWVLYLALEKNIWVYPILEVMDWTYRIIFFALLWGFFLLLYRTGALITFKVWGGVASRASSAKKVK